MSYDNELHKHKTADTIKWIVVFVLLIALIGAVVGMALKMGGVFDKLNEEPTVEENVVRQKYLVPGEISEHGISLMSEAVAASDPDAEKKCVLTATVTAENDPSDLFNMVDWTIAWSNPDAEWARGKNVAEYLTCVAREDGGLVADVTCLQGFNEQITITCTSLVDEQKYATCAVDYVKRVKGFNLTYSTGSPYLNLTENKEASTVFSATLNEDGIVYDEVGSLVVVPEVKMSVVLNGVFKVGEKYSEYSNSKIAKFGSAEFIVQEPNAKGRSLDFVNVAFPLMTTYPSFFFESPSENNNYALDGNIFKLNVTSGSINEYLWSLLMDALKKKLASQEPEDVAFSIAFDCTQHIDGADPIVTTRLMQAIKFGTANFPSISANSVSSVGIDYSRYQFI